MELYIQSRGFKQDCGYRWIKTDQNNYKLLEPYIITKENLYRLIDDSNFSLVLGRYHGELVLFVTGLSVSKRTDSQKSNIRNIIACVGDDSETTERNLRGLAYAALSGDLDKIVDEHIIYDPDTETEFRVSPELIEVLSKYQAEDSQDLISDDTSNKKGNTEFLRKELAKLLNRHNLPKRDGHLVVVTKNIDPKTLDEANVWRGLSSLQDSNKWIEILRPLEPTSGGSITVDPKAQVLITLLLIFLLLALLLTLRGILVKLWTILTR